VSNGQKSKAFWDKRGRGRIFKQLVNLLKSDHNWKVHKEFLNYSLVGQWLQSTTTTTSTTLKMFDVERTTIIEFLCERKIDRFQVRVNMGPQIITLGTLIIYITKITVILFKVKPIILGYFLQSYPSRI
jgi:hypothetical protein